MRSLRRAAIVSFVLATIVSCVFFFGGWLQWFASWPSFVVDHWPKLDLVPSAFSLLLPGAWRSGLHLYFQSGTYCFPGSMWWESMRYLRTAIPAYSIVFLLVILLVRRTTVKLT